MESFFICYQRFLDILEKTTFFIACTLLSLLLCNELMGIFFDTVVGQSVVWVPDMSVLLFAWIIFLGGGVIARHGGHIGVDFLMEKFPNRLNLCIRIGHLILALLLSGVMVYFGVKNAIFVGKTQSAVYLEISLFYYYVSVPVGGFLLAVNSIGVILPNPRKKRLNVTPDV